LIAFPEYVIVILLAAISSMPSVLLVDDDESLLLTTSALLEDDFEVSTARSGREALAYLAGPHGPHVAVLCTDLRMPGMDGVELIGHVAERHPWVAGILVTAYQDYLSSGREGKVTYDVLLKPYSPEDLLERVRRAAQRGKLKVSLDQKRGPSAPTAGSSPTAVGSNGARPGSAAHLWRAK
jgi:DNA-binding NtrC family response regulator